MVRLNRVVVRYNYVGPVVVEYSWIRVREIVVTENWTAVVTTRQEYKTVHLLGAGRWTVFTADQPLSGEV